MEMNIPFEVGDRVVAINKVAGVLMPGAMGTVVHISNKIPPIGVQFDELVPEGVGHTCHDHCTRGYGRYGRVSEFELLTPEFNEEVSKELISFITSFTGGDKIEI